MKLNNALLKDLQVIHKTTQDYKEGKTGIGFKRLSDSLLNYMYTNNTSSLQKLLQKLIKKDHDLASNINTLKERYPEYEPYIETIAEKTVTEINAIKQRKIERVDATIEPIEALDKAKLLVYDLYKHPDLYANRIPTKEQIKHTTSLIILELQNENKNDKIVINEPELVNEILLCLFLKDDLPHIKNKD